MNDWQILRSRYGSNRSYKNRKALSTFELRKAKWMVYKAESIKQNYKRLVNWASESGAEG